MTQRLESLSKSLLLFILVAGLWLGWGAGPVRGEAGISQEYYGVIWLFPGDLAESAVGNGYAICFDGGGLGLEIDVATGLVGEDESVDEDVPLFMEIKLRVEPFAGDFRPYIKLGMGAVGHTVAYENVSGWTVMGYDAVGVGVRFLTDDRKAYVFLEYESYRIRAMELIPAFETVGIKVGFGGRL